MTGLATTVDTIRECPHCKTQWTMNQIFHDPDIIPIGLCFLQDEPELNCYLFTHIIPRCRTTFAVPVEAFALFVVDQIPAFKATGLALCEGHCREIDDNQPCSVTCYFAPFRLLLGKMRQIRATEN